MEQGHGGEHLVAGSEHGVGGDDLLRQGVEVQVGQQDALGLAGGAAGVQDHSRIIRFARNLIVPEAGFAQAAKFVPADDRRIFGDLLQLPSLGEHISGLERLGQGIPNAGDDDVHGAGVLADGLHLVVELIQSHHSDALGLVDVKLNLLFTGQGMHHVGDGADEIGGVKDVDGLRAVGHGDGHAVPLPNTDGAQALGAALDLLYHLLIGGGTPHKVKGNCVGILPCNALHSLVHGALEIIQMGGHVPQIFHPWGFGGNRF